MNRRNSRTADWVKPEGNSTWFFAALAVFVTCLVIANILADASVAA